MVFWLKPSHMV